MGYNDVTLCHICGGTIDHEHTVIMIESGQMIEGFKGKPFITFAPEWALPRDRWADPKAPECAGKIMTHFQCCRQLATENDVTTRMYARHECSSCGKNFHKNRWAFRYTVGSLENGDVFVKDMDVPRADIFCVECALRIHEGRGRKRFAQGCL